MSGSHSSPNRLKATEPSMGSTTRMQEATSKAKSDMRPIRGTTWRCALLGERKPLEHSARFAASGRSSLSRTTGKWPSERVMRRAALDSEQFPSYFMCEKNLWPDASPAATL